MNTPKLGELYNFIPVPDGSKYGIESEVECVNNALPIINTEGWVSKPDTSLRYNGMEYVSRTPFTDASVKREVEFLFKRLNKLDILHDSPRTSTHLHYNMRGFTHTQVLTNAVAYWLVENILFKFCGEDREGNLFCLRLHDASGVINYIVNDIQRVVKQGSIPFRSFSNADNVRYGGLNLNSLPRFGTLELRGMRGVYDPQVVLTWCGMADKLFTNATRYYKTPTQVVSDYLKIGSDKFVTKLMEEHTDTLAKCSDVKKWGDLISVNMSHVFPLVINTDWSTLDKSSKPLKTSTTTDAVNNIGLEAFAEAQRVMNNLRPRRVTRVEALIGDDF